MAVEVYECTDGTVVIEMTRDEAIQFRSVLAHTEMYKPHADIYYKLWDKLMLWHPKYEEMHVRWQQVYV